MGHARIMRVRRLQTFGLSIIEVQGANLRMYESLDLWSILIFPLKIPDYLQYLNSLSQSQASTRMNNSTEVWFINSPLQGCSAMASIMFTSTLSLISMAALVGNILVVATVVKTPSLRTSTNYYIVNMAFSDLLGPLFNWLLYFSEGMLTPTVFISGTLASSVCKLGMYLRAVSQIVSILSLVLIALDRFVAIVFPLKAMTIMNVKIRVIFLLLSWLIPFFFVLPYALFAKIIREGNQTFCRFMMNDEALTIFNGVGIVLSYAFPLIAIIALYSVIIRSLKKTPNLLKGKEDAKRRQQNLRIVKILISIVFAFFICWTPLTVYSLLKKLYPSLFTEDKCFYILGFTFYVFPSLSTAVNPIILFVLSTNYNRALKVLCSFHFSVCKRESEEKQLGQPELLTTENVKVELTEIKPHCP